MKVVVALAALLAGLAAPAAAGPLDRPETYEVPTRVAGVYPVGRQPVDLVFAANGDAWVASMTDGTVVRLAANGTRLATVKVGPGARKLALDLGGNPWVYCWGDNAVYRLSQEGVVVARYAVGKSVNDMAFDPEGDLWLASTASNEVIRMSPGGQVKTRLPVRMPNQVAVDVQGTVWASLVAGKGSTNLVAFRPGRMEGYTLPGTPQAIELGPDGRIWATFHDAMGRVSRLSADRRQLDDLWTGFANSNVIVDRGLLWVTNSRYDMSRPDIRAWTLDNPVSNTVSQLSPGGRVMATYSVGSDAWLVKVSPVGEPWVLNYVAGTVTRLRP